MSNYLKKILFILLIFVMPYINSSSKAMNAEDYEGSTVRTRNVSFATEDRKEDRKDVSSSMKQSMSSQVVSLEDSKVSWASYLISPIKTAVQMPYEVIKYVANNPQKGMMIGLILSANVLTVAAQVCHPCVCISVDTGRTMNIGNSSDCSRDCERWALRHYRMWYCNHTN